MRVLAIVQAWNRDDPIRGFIVRWMEKLAERVDKLIVLSLEQRHTALHSNIKLFSLGKEDSFGRGRRLRYLVRWHRHMRTILEEEPPDIVFTHMSPIYSVLAAPYVRRKGIPTVTWYAHRQLTTTLKIAHRLPGRMVSTNKDSYPYRWDKLVPLGQGIDIDLFSPRSIKLYTPPLLLSVGRLSPIKNLLMLIDAVHLLRQRGYDIHFALVGDAPERDRAYAQAVRQRVQELGLEGRVQFPGAVPNDHVVHWYRRCFAHVNASPPDHSLDKAVLEAMACAKPSLSSTSGFRETLGRWADLLLFQHDNTADLAGKIERLLGLDSVERRAMGMELRQSVVGNHSLSGLVDRLVELFGELSHRQ